ncbi:MULTISPECIES: hypothetical protein [Thermomonosporaceae]|uniref:hypothetical protein n=1 Tax=Thermomonosporaceae TaxID=2012 RepID=UPI00255AB8C9|nr:MULTISPECIES: hypothetical protein [Thermomonosporaceae]MDL4776485.1 hypothetical protein [Actinomadura xylanilytica]
MTTIRSMADGVRADDRRLLRAALRLDSVVTGANGLAYLALAGPLEELLGLDPVTGRAIGAFLVVYAVAVWAVSVPAEPRRTAVGAVVEANVLWPVLSVVAVATGWLSLSTAGGVWAVLQAVVVAGFGALQFAALRRVTRRR